MDKSAFPQPLGAPFSSGMTLREWYAGMALQGMLAGDVRMHTQMASDADVDIGTYFTKAAFLLARDMIEASHD